jgi:hypothetical protein
MITIPRWLKRLLVFVAVLGVVLVVVAYTLNSYLERTIIAKIESEGGHVSAVQISLLTRSIDLHDLKVDSRGDTTIKDLPEILIQRVSLDGIHLIPLWRVQRLVINRVRLDRGKISYTLVKRNKTASKVNNLLKLIHLKKIAIHNLHLMLNRDSTMTFSGLLNGEAKGLIFDLDTAKASKFICQDFDLVIDTLRFSQLGGEYTASIQRITLNTNSQQIKLDSVLLTPQYGKYEFANRLGQQRARLNISIPALLLNGWQWDEMLKESFIARTMLIQSFDLYSFKDKRLPFLRTHNIPLPMESFAKLDWVIKVDSIIINDSHITIETFPEEGMASGILTFNKLNAIILGLTNRWTEGESRYAILNASAMLMNKGKLNAQFDFPLDGSAIYKAKGSITKMDFGVLNDLLGNMANIRIISGYLEDMTFNFNYTDYVSKGRLDMAYQNLRILGLDKNKTSTNELKTILIRLFTDKDKRKSTPLSKTVGIIDIERNRKKYLFNTWWKSIQDGLQSSMVGNRKRSR